MEMRGRGEEWVGMIDTQHILREEKALHVRSRARNARRRDASCRVASRRFAVAIASLGAATTTLSRSSPKKDAIYMLIDGLSWHGINVRLIEIR